MQDICHVGWGGVVFVVVDEVPPFETLGKPNGKQVTKYSMDRNQDYNVHLT